MSVSTSISRNGINGCDSAPTTTSGCSGTDYAQSHQSQFDIMFQEVQERMYKLFERYSQLKERNRHMASARQSAADDSEPESKISTSKTILTVGTVTQEERGEDTGSETSCSCSLGSDRRTQETDNESLRPKNIAASVASKPTRISNEADAFIPRGISPVPGSIDPESVSSRSRLKPKKASTKKVSPSVPVSKLSSDRTSKLKSGNSRNNGVVVETDKKDEPPLDKENKTGLNQSTVKPSNNIPAEKSRPHSAVTSICPQCEDKTCKQHRFPVAAVGYQLTFPPTKREQKYSQEYGCAFNGQPNGRNHGRNIMQISRLRSACMCVNQELPDPRKVHDEEVPCQMVDRQDVSFGACEAVSLQESFYNRKKVLIIRSEDRQEQIQRKHDDRMHPSWWSGPSTSEPRNMENAWYQRSDYRSASTNHKQDQKAEVQENERMSNECFIEQQKNLPLIYRDNEISLKRARMETSRRMKQLEPKKIDLAKVLENKRVRRQKMMAYSRIVRNRNHYLYKKNSGS